MYSYVASKAVEDSTFSVSEIKRMDRFDRFDGTSHVQISAKHLIEGLLPLTISTAHASTSLSSNGINLINENDAGRLLLARCLAVSCQISISQVEIKTATTCWARKVPKC